jgi:hypothetical protein
VPASAHRSCTFAPVLSVNNYSQDYVDDRRRKVDANLAAYRKMAKAAGASAALEAFEPVFFNNLVLALETYFTHRARGLEGKDGNPLNEVRVLCTSMLSNDDVMAADKTIKMKPEAFVLKLEVGDRIAIREADFVALADAFFAEIEARYI